MTMVDVFRSSASAAAPPDEVKPAAQARGCGRRNWDKADKVVQGYEGAMKGASVPVRTLSRVSFRAILLRVLHQGSQTLGPCQHDPHQRGRRGSGEGLGAGGGKGNR